MAGGGREEKGKKGALEGCPERKMLVNRMEDAAMLCMKWQSGLKV